MKEKCEHIKQLEDLAKYYGIGIYGEEIQIVCRTCDLLSDKPVGSYNSKISYYFPDEA